VCRASAKVPIVKCWDPELELACDLNVNNPLALENTRMIKTYVQLDDRVRPLAKIIKYWTKRRILNDAGTCHKSTELSFTNLSLTAFGGTISSYTWICMIISFLQRRDPQILPSLQKTEGKRRDTKTGSPPPFADDLGALRGSGDANKESLAELLFQFFRHYGYEFEYSQYVVSVKEGRLLSRKEKGWEPSNYMEKEARNRLCVEEPFTTNRNLGNSADDYAWHGIHTEIRRAFELLAEGGQLEKCCEQYEFPPEEKPIFQKPTPKPAPTLRRSASQSGRSNHEQGSGRSRKGNNRNQSAQRAGNRRASSGASFSNQRMSQPFHSPPIGPSAVDYLAAKGNLHDQLYQQYQFLQAQQDVLRSQLVQHAHQQGQASGQAQPRVGDLTGSPHQSRAYTNGLSSPRYMDHPPQTAPLLPGYLYHYPARYPPPSPMSQARSREGTSTNPSSPSLVAAVPALRRQVHRASVPDGSSASIRSQSQPGRSLPHPLTLQQQVHPGYDVSGAIPAQYQSVGRSPQFYNHGPPGFQLPFSPVTAVHPTAVGSVDSAMPKEYMGYYMSPQLGPQQFATASTQIQMPPMTLRDPPSQRQRRVTPELMPPVANGKHSSRSPSPLGHLRSYSTMADLRSTSKIQAPALHSPSRFEPLEPNSIGSTVLSSPSEPVLAPVDLGGPLIVNGSNPSIRQEHLEPSNGRLHSPQQHVPDNISETIPESEPFRTRSLSLRTSGMEMFAPLDQSDASGESAPLSPRAKITPRLVLSPNGTTHISNGVLDHFNDPLPLAAPLLSPVAELRTPSPTQVHMFEKQESPQANALLRATKIANAKQGNHNAAENDPPVAATNLHKSALNTHERKGSTPNSSLSNPTAESLTLPQPTSGATLSAQNGNQNPWQQATGRKNHKKNKSSAASPRGPQGQQMPVNESERKGG